MRTLKYVMIMLAITAAACSNDRNEETVTTSDTTMMTTPVDGSIPGNTTVANDPNNMNNMGEKNTVNDGTNARTNSNNTSSTTARTGNIRATGRTRVGNVTESANAGESARERSNNMTPFEETGHYNSDIHTPKPRNLDAQRYRDNPPTHTYGDTSKRARGGSLH